jgi:hypothetical protein
MVVDLRLSWGVFTDDLSRQTTEARKADHGDSTTDFLWNPHHFFSLSTIVGITTPDFFWKSHKQSVFE